jgi:hypothetical protein
MREFAVPDDNPADTAAQIEYFDLTSSGIGVARPVANVTST